MEINAAVEQMNGVTQHVAASSEESASSAEELSSQAGRMRELVGGFRLTLAEARAETVAAPAATSGMDGPGREPDRPRGVRRQQRVTPTNGQSAQELIPVDEKPALRAF